MGKNHTIDAANAARAVLVGHATATPTAADGVAEMLRRAKFGSSPTTPNAPSE
jgi:hypothetical protein